MCDTDCLFKLHTQEARWFTTPPCVLTLCNLLCNKQKHARAGNAGERPKKRNSSCHPTTEETIPVTISGSVLPEHTHAHTEFFKKFFSGVTLMTATLTNRQLGVQVALGWFGLFLGHFLLIIRTSLCHFSSRPYKLALYQIPFYPFKTTL